MRKFERTSHQEQFGFSTRLGRFLVGVWKGTGGREKIHIAEQVLQPFAHPVWPCKVSLWPDLLYQDWDVC